MLEALVVDLEALTARHEIRQDCEEEAGLGRAYLLLAAWWSCPKRAERHAADVLAP